MTGIALTQKRLDVAALEQKVKSMYRDVAVNPHGEFHFEMGRALAERLGYAPADLDAIPAQAIDSFAGVGYYFDLAALEPSETVVDLGSGSGMDSFIAALKVGPRGRVIGVDMTDEMLALARKNAAARGATNVEFREGRLEALPVEDGTVDLVISNCVVNLVPDKAAAFREMARVLKPGGTISVSDLVLIAPLPESVKSSVEAYVGCIAGASPIGEYAAQLFAVGLEQVSIPRMTNASKFPRSCGVKPTEHW